MYVGWGDACSNGGHAKSLMSFNNKIGDGGAGWTTQEISFAMVLNSKGWLGWVGIITMWL